LRLFAADNGLSVNVDLSDLGFQVRLDPGFQVRLDPFQVRLQRQVKRTLALLRAVLKDREVLHRWFSSQVSQGALSAASLRTFALVVQVFLYAPFYHANVITRYIFFGATPPKVLEIATTALWDRSYSMLVILTFIVCL
jgi:hypothetical protein